MEETKLPHKVLERLIDMTVKDYVYTRSKELYGRPMRILDKNHKYIGQWWLFPDYEVKEVKVTTKYIFIFV